jgi:pimeloyl-ACP methyl ester carboxylesterase
MEEEVNTNYQAPRRAGGRVIVALVAFVALVASGFYAAQASTASATAKPISAATPTSVSQSVAASRAKLPKGVKPTIVMVHGAFADASGWQAVATQLQDDGYTVYAPANPLRGVQNDADYLNSFLHTIQGPVVLVGHSYGGFVITNAATGNPNVVGLVYIAAFAPDQGETGADVMKLGGHPEESLLLDAALPRPYPGAPEGDADVYIDPTKFRKVFCADLPRKQARFMAASQRPAAFFSLGTPSGPPAWKTIPSYYLVAKNDKAIPPTAERYMAARMGAYTRTVKSSHVAMISHPKAVTKLILRAAGGR